MTPTAKTLELWFPNYKNNPGIVSKELLAMIRKEIQHFEVEVIRGRFEGYETFLLELEFANEGYLDYVTELILKNYGGFPDPLQLQPGDQLLGRVFSPGKVGFGIFVDIGLRGSQSQNDALLPLYQLREDLEVEDLSTREIVKMLGMVNAYPVPVVIDTIEYGTEPKIDLRLAPSYVEQVLEWAEEGKERMIFTKTLQSSITRLIRELDLQPFIDDVTAMDPLTTVLTCDRRTNASGLVPKLGSRLKNAPIGIFHP